MDCFGAHAPRDTPPPSRGALAPESWMNHVRRNKQRAQGKPGARCTHSLACESGVHASRSHRFTGTPGLPCAMVLTVSFALSPVTGLFCHRRKRNAQALSPLERQRRGVRTTRLRRPRQHHSSSHAFARLTLPRPSHPTPTFVTIASRPSFGVGPVRSIAVSTKSRSGIFFERGLDRRVSDLPVGQNLLSLQFVGWVERNAIPITIQYNGDGFRKELNPSYALETVYAVLENPMAKDHRGIRLPSGPQNTANSELARKIVAALEKSNVLREGSGEFRGQVTNQPKRF
jgi:hypothetical protein